MAPGITQVRLLRLMAPMAIISRPRFTRWATPDQKRPMPYVSLPALEINDGSIAMAMSSSSPILSRAIPMLTLIQSTDALKLEAKVLAVCPPQRDSRVKLILPGINATVRIVKTSQLRNLLLILVVVFSNTDLHRKVKSLRIANTFMV